MKRIVALSSCCVQFILALYFFLEHTLHVL